MGKYDDFSYDNINKQNTIYKDYGTYLLGSFHSSTHDISFGYDDGKTELVERTDGNGWKFQISINHNQLEQSWNLIVEILVEFKLSTVKTLKRKYLNHLEGSECGKEITIYCCYEPRKSWEDILTKIELILLHNNIKPNSSAALA